MNPTRKQPLFIVSGASGIGKSTACELLFQCESDYIVLESDILWHSVYDGPPDDGYRAYRELCLTLCAHISQIGKPCVLCGCGEPWHFEVCDARQYFTEIHYFAIVGCDKTLETRMREGRSISDTDWIQGSQHFNRWLRENGEQTSPPMRLLDNSDLTPIETAEIIHQWIKERLSP